MAHVGVIRIPIPNPFFESDVNAYVIPAEPVTMIDTGIGTEAALERLERGLEKHGLAIEKVRQIVLTHKHPDHMGLARTLQERSGATVFVHEDDWRDVTQFEERREDFLSGVGDRLDGWGAPAAELRSLLASLRSAPRLARSTPAEPLAEGQKIPVGPLDLEVIHTPGHTPGSICLRYGRHLFTGDHVLPDYTPNVGAGELHETGMLQRFLDSLGRLRPLTGDGVRVWPGHGAPIENLEARITAIVAHHQEREAAILAIVRAQAGMTIYQIARALFGELRGFHIVLGAAEANSHVERLLDSGDLRRHEGRYSPT